MCGIWDWQSTIVKDLNDSQDPKLYAVLSRNRICRDLRAFFRQQMSQSGHCLLFLPFFLYDGFPNTPPFNHLAHCSCEEELLWTYQS